MARGLVDPTSDHFFNRSRSRALKKADLVLVFGTPFDFRLSYGVATSPVPGSQSGTVGSMLMQMTQPVINPKDAQVIQIDLEASDEIGRNRDNGVDVGLVGDSGLVAGRRWALRWRGWTPATSGRLVGGDARRREVKQQAKMRAEMERGLSDPPEPPAPLRDAVDRFIRPGDIVVGDGGDFVGTAAYVAAPYTAPAPGWIPGPLGTLGVGPRLRDGREARPPDARVILMLGDGSFGLNGMEFEAIARQGIKVVGIIGNDAGWTQICRGQRQIYGEERLRRDDAGLHPLREGRGGPAAATASTSRRWLSWCRRWSARSRVRDRRWST
jgi:acetolactate synthase-1/2/3 large subunit